MRSWPWRSHPRPTFLWEVQDGVPVGTLIRPALSCPRPPACGRSRSPSVPPAVGRMRSGLGSHPLRSLVASAPVYRVGGLQTTSDLGSRSWGLGVSGVSTSYIIPSRARGSEMDEFGPLRTGFWVRTPISRSCLPGTTLSDRGKWALLTGSGHFDVTLQKWSPEGVSKIGP